MGTIFEKNPQIPLQMGTFLEKNSENPKIILQMGNCGAKIDNFFYKWVNFVMSRSEYLFNLLHEWVASENTDPHMCTRT